MRLWRQWRVWVGVGALCVASVASEPSHAQLLGEAEISVFGLSVDVDTRPDLDDPADGPQTGMDAVRDVPTGVQTLVGSASGIPATGLPRGVQVVAELSGPSYGDEVVTLRATPNQLMEFPRLGVAGQHVLSNIRLEDAEGQVLLSRDAARAPVLIDVLDKLLVSSVTSRPLSLDEIQERGIVIDDDSFAVLEFTVALSVGTEKVIVDLPVAVPRVGYAGINVEAPSLTGFGRTAQKFSGIRIPNFSLSGFQMKAPPEVEEKGIELPGIDGVIIIPGNVAFLKQFFSVMLQTSNTAPDGSGLVVHDVKATVKLPGGDDGAVGTSDDPLSVAETIDESSKEELPLLDVNASDTLVPQGTNSAEFLIRGDREGTHRVDFDIEGDLFVPALGKTVPVSGVAAGVVQVRNPTFHITLAHPNVVREGGAYSIHATVTNTSSTTANLFKLEIAKRRLSGARLDEGETGERTLETLLGGDAQTFEFQLIAETTGEIRGTTFLSDPGINGSFMLFTGVGDTGIPLSPDTIVLPSTVEYLPEEPDIVFAALRVLGQAYSVATAPSGALPPDIARIGRGFVFERAVALAREGLHKRFGESIPGVGRDLLYDYLGGELLRLDERYPDDSATRDRVESDLRAFDGLRRASGAGQNLTRVAAQLLAGDLSEKSLADLQLAWAERFASRPAHLSFGASSRGSPVVLLLRDAAGRQLGSLEPGASDLRNIPFATRLSLRDEPGSSDELMFVAAPESSRYELEIAAPEGGSDLDLSVVLPSQGGMRHVVYPRVSVAAGGSAYLLVDFEQSAVPVLEIDSNGDGVFETPLDPEFNSLVKDPPPEVLGVYQWQKGSRPQLEASFGGGDPLGRMLGVLFDEEVDPQVSVQPANYALADNRVDQVILQPDRRLLFLNVDRPVGPFVPRELVITGIPDLRGNVLESDSRPFIADPDRGMGGRVLGRVITSDGRPVPFAAVDYIQALDSEAFLEICFPQDMIVTYYTADAAGHFEIDFVLRSSLPDLAVCNGDHWLNDEGRPTSNFKLQATDPDTGEVGKASTKIQFDGQTLVVDVIIRGYGGIEGRVLNELGEVVVGAEPGALEPLLVTARNLSTGEVFQTFVDSEGRYAFPRSFVSPSTGAVDETPAVTVGNLSLAVIDSDPPASGITSVNVPAAGVTVSQDIVLFSPDRYGDVRGRVLEVDGITPAANVRVEVAGQILIGLGLSGASYKTGVVAVVYSDANGEFAVSGVPVGEVEVRAFRQASYEQARAVDFLEEAGVSELTLVFPGRGGTVLGTVKNANGETVAGAEVAGGPTLTKTDADGRFEVTDLPIGSFTFASKGPENPGVGSTNVQTRGPNDVLDIVITLPAVGSISGYVYAADYEGDELVPLPYQKLQLWLSRNRGVIGETFSLPDGSYHFRNFPLGRYQVRAIQAETGDGGMTNTEIRYNNDNATANVRLRGLGTISGRVVQRNNDQLVPVPAYVIVSYKMWQAVQSPDHNEFNYYLDYLELLRELDPDLDATIDRVLEENGFNEPRSEFFMLVNQQVLVESCCKVGEPDGKFSFAGPVAAGPFSLQASAADSFTSPAFVSDAVPRWPADPDARDVNVGDLILEPSVGTVTGTVYLPDGETPVGADVRVTVNGLFEATTDGEGRFELFPVPRGKFRLEADTLAPPAENLPLENVGDIETEPFEKRNVQLKARGKGVLQGGDEVDVELRLVDVAGVHVTVLDSEGETVNGARVNFSTESSFDEEGPAEFTDGNGEIDFFPVPEGLFSVSASAPFQAATGRTAGEILENPDNGHVESVIVRLGAVTTASGQVIETQIFGEVEGTVFKADGTPLANPAQVRLTSRGVAVLTSSGSDGYYRAENVPGGLVQVQVFEPFTARRGSATGNLTLAEPPLDIPVTLVGLGSVQGEVLTSNGLEPIPGAQITLIPSGNFSDRLRTRSLPDGTYTLPGIPIGPYQVSAYDSRPGRELAGSATDQIEADGEIVTTDVYLESAGQITGTVYPPGTPLEPSGQPEAGSVGAKAQVSIGGPTDAQYNTSDIGENAGVFTTSEFLPLGYYRVTARGLAPNQSDGVSTTVQLYHDGQQLELHLVMEGTARVSGRVVEGPLDTAVTDATLVLHSGSSFATGTFGPITTNDQGYFAFDGVPVGTFSISVVTYRETPLGATVAGEVVAHGANVAFEDGDADPDHDAIALQESENIFGQVVLDDGQTGASGALVFLEGGSVHVTRIASATGEFRFDGIPLGSYTLSAIELSVGGVAALELELDGSLQPQDQELGRDAGLLVLDSNRPHVVSTDPAANASNADSDRPIVVVFSESVDPDSVNEESFRVAINGEPVLGSYEVVPASSGRALGPRAIFTPSQRLPDLQQVEVELRGDVLGFEGQVEATGIRDPAGLSLLPDTLYRFTTGDFTPPSLLSFTPAAGAVEVRANSVIRLEFDEPIDPESLTLEVLREGSPIGGVVTTGILGGRVVVFTPQPPLAPNAVYTVRVTGLVADVAGNAMDEEIPSASFETVDTQAPELQGLDLPKADELLEGATAVVSVLLAGDETPSRVEYFVDGVLWAVVSEPPFTFALELSPELAQGFELSAIAFDAAGNPSSPQTQTLSVVPNQPPGVSVVAPSPGSVSQGARVEVDVAATDDLGLSEIQFSVNDGQVASGSASVEGLADSAHFAFTVPADFDLADALVIRAGATDLLGDVAEAAPVALEVVDLLAPSVAIGSPAGGSAVDPGASLVVFVRADDASGVSELQLEASGAAPASQSQDVSPAASPASHSFALTIPEDAASNATLSLIARARDSNDLVGETSIVLRVRDFEAPQVSIVPVGGSQVEPGSQVELQVEASDAGSGVVLVSLSAAGLSAQPQGFEASSQVNANFTLTLPAELGLGDGVVVTASARDVDGNTGVSAPLVLTAADLTPPEVALVSPAPGSQVDPGATFELVVSASDARGVAQIVCTASGAAPASQTQPFDPPVASIQHACSFQVPADAAKDTAIDLTATASDAAGNPSLPAALQVTVADVKQPRVESVTPVDGSLEVDPEAVLTLVFDEPVDPDSFDSGFSLIGPDGDVPGTRQTLGDGSRFVFTPADPQASAGGLVAGASYTLSVSQQVTDLAGNALEVPFSASFQVRGDVLGPCVVGVAPAQGETGVSLTPEFRAEFDEPIDPASVAADGGRLIDVDTGTVLGTRALAGDPGPLGQVTSVQLELTDPTQLETEQVVRVEWLRGFEDVFGNPARTAVACAGGHDPDEPLAFTHTFKTGSLVITAPADGGFVVEEELIEITAQAQAGLEVVSVEFLANAASLEVDAEAPFEIRTAAPRLEDLGGTASLRLAVVGTTANGAVARAEEVVLTVVAEGLDSDGDGLLNGEERDGVTDPFDDDTDDDGLNDGAEIAAGTNPMEPDSDGDGILDGLDATTGPQLLSLSPADDSTDVPLNARAEARFGEPLETFAAGALRLLVDATDTPVSGGPVLLEQGDKQLSFTPDDPLALGETYRVELALASLADAEGNPATTDGAVDGVLSQRFTTVAFGLLRPVDGAAVSRGGTLEIEAAVGVSLGVASVTFEVNDELVAEVSEPPFQAVYPVPDSADVSQLTVVVTARAAEGAALASAEAVVSLVDQLQVASRLYGVAFGETLDLRFFTTANLTQPLEVEIEVADPSVASVSSGPFQIDAGESELSVPVTGGSCDVPEAVDESERDNVGCGTTLWARSAQAELSVLLAVGPAVAPEVRDEALRHPDARGVSAEPVGVTLHPLPTLGQVVLAADGSGALSVGLLEAPAEGPINVTVTSSDPLVVLVNGVEETSVPLVGGTDVAFTLTAFDEGEAVLTLRAGNAAGSLRVVVGTPAPGATAPVLAAPVGLAVRALPTLGQVILPPDGSGALSVGLLEAPAEEQTDVTVTSSDASVAQVDGPVTVLQNSTDATFTVRSGSAGEAVLTLRAGDAAGSLRVVVGTPAPGATAPVLAAPVGLAVRALPTLGQVILPPGGSGEISVGLLEALAEEETDVTVTSSDDSVAQVDGPVVILQNSTDATFEVRSGSAGEAVLTLRAGNAAGSLRVVVGTPAPGATAPVLAAPVGVCVEPCDEEEP